MRAAKIVGTVQVRRSCPEGDQPCPRDVGQRNGITWTVRTPEEGKPDEVHAKIGGPSISFWTSGVDDWSPQILPVRLLTRARWRFQIGYPGTVTVDRQEEQLCDNGCGLLIPPATEPDRPYHYTWFWTAPGTYDVTLTAGRRNADNSFTELCSTTRTYNVARTTDDPDRQAVDYYVNGGTNAPDEAAKGSDARLHVLWHTARDKEKYFMGEDWLAFHRMLVRSFDDWRTTFGYPVVTPYDGTDPVPIVDGAYDMVDLTRPETAAGTFRPDCYHDGSGCAPEPWFTTLGDGHSARGDDVVGKTCYYAPDRNGVAELVPTGQRTLADFKDARGLGCVLNGTHHRLMHEANTGAFHFIDTTPRDPLFWAYHKWASGYGPGYLPPIVDPTVGVARVAGEPTPSAVLTAWQKVKAQGPPGVSIVFPPKGIEVSRVPGIQVLFWEAVTGVVPADLTVNGSPATSVVGADLEYVFSGFDVPLPPPAGGVIPLAVEIRSGNIKDLGGTPFPGDGWQYQLEHDEDGDDIPDEFDNCPDVYNPDQTNTDATVGETFGYHGAGHAAGNGLGDDLGDACDPDDDGDTIPDVMELANGTDPLDWRDPDMCPLDPNKTEPGDCGCGSFEIDRGGGQVDCVLQLACAAPAATHAAGHHPNAAEPPGCDDGDPCTTDGCTEPTGCHSTAITGFDGLECRVGRLRATDLCGQDPVDKKLGTLLRKSAGAAQVTAAKARVATKPAKQTKLLRKVDGLIKRLTPKVAKADAKHKITPACRATIDKLVTDARQAAASVTP